MIEKFRGTLYGALAGDCFGALFQENSILTKGSRLVLRNFLDSLEKQSAIVGIEIQNKKKTKLRCSNKAKSH